MSLSEQDNVLSEIKTLVRTLNTWGNVIVPSLDGKETTAHERLVHFINKAQTEFGMSLDQIEDSIQ